MTNKTFITLDSIAFSYTPESPVLEKISFKLHRGRTLGVVGPNGGGKSTLLKIVAGLLRPKSGSFIIEGQTYSQIPTGLKKKISYLPQNIKTNDLMPIKVWELIQMGTLGKNSGHQENLDEMINFVGLTDKKDHLVRELSGGEKQRAHLAKVLVANPELIVLDEPTLGLDSKGQDQLINLISLIKDKYQTSFILVDHNLNQIIKHCDDLICLNKRFHWHDKKELLTKNILEEIYHCEFEHLLIHDTGSGTDHHECEHEHDEQHDHKNLTHHKKTEKKE